MPRTRRGLRVLGPSDLPAVRELTSRSPVVDVFVGRAEELIPGLREHVGVRRLFTPQDIGLARIRIGNERPNGLIRRGGGGTDRVSCFSHTRERRED